jgi:hypothetical protein
VRVKIVEERADAVLVGHVERGGRGAPARLADLARGGLERFRASPGDQDRRPLAREPPRDRLPDARPAAGDDRGPARQPASVPLPLGAEQRQRDAGEVDPVGVLEPGLQHAGVRVVGEQAAGGGGRAPVGERPLARGVDADEVQAGRTPRDPVHEPGADPLALPAGDHRVAVVVVAEPGDVVDLDAGLPSPAREVQRHVQRVAGVRER